MKTALVALSLALSIALTSSAVLAAPSLQPRDQGQEQSQAQEHGQGKGVEKNQDKSQGQDKKDKDEKPQDRSKDEKSETEKALNERHGAAGVVANRTDSGFELVTKDGTIKIIVNESTRFSAKADKSNEKADKHGDKKLDYGVVKNDLRVNVNGKPDGKGNLTAKYVHVIPSKAEGTFGHVVGTVAEFSRDSSGNGTIVVDSGAGKTFTFNITASTKIVTPEGKAAPVAGDTVTVVGTKDGTPTATGIVVH